ncbi:MAG TPA: prolyl oligopeptidase family serine peptidase [Longimicrobium sp.]|nr:prolyl oligopeptidase family serine peptidase [Longimicrobium sp.]
MPTFACRAAALAVSLLLPSIAGAQRRVMRPEDLFRVEGIGAVTWSPDGARAIVEIRRPGRWLDASIPTAMLALVEAAAGTLRVVSPSSPELVGSFGAAWSPDGRRLAFLSVDTSAAVRPWVWTVGEGAPRVLPELRLREAASDPPVVMWSDDDHLVLMAAEPSAPAEGPLYFRILRGRNVAEAWRRARDGRSAAVAVIDSRGPDSAAAPSRLVSVDVRTGTVTTLARGALHRPRLSADGRTLTYRRENPVLPAAPIETFFAPSIQGEAAYDLPNWGGEVHHVDARSGTPVPPPGIAGTRVAAAPAATLRVTNDPAAGSTLWLVRPGTPDLALWRGNGWIRELDLGRSEPIPYTTRDGSALTGWLLYPPGHVAGRAIPIVTVVYPGTLHGSRAPEAFSPFNASFEHPQLFAALGYGVLLPSMPEPAAPLRNHALDSLTVGVLPLLDTIVARGIADPSRIAVIGQSAGGHATLGLVARTDRFRTAIASASYANLTSLYGTFYGQYRYGDGGHPQRAQVLRMLQFERGYYGAGAPPWEEPARYRENSPIEEVEQVRTPVMLVHGDADFIPVQQAEEFFTALYRRGVRARLVRYSGEGHTITARANVLDLWRRFDDWLRETMPPAP